MPNYHSPGVYVEEVESGSRPIEGVGTAVAAFVGLASDGPVDQPTLITSWDRFCRVFGTPVDGYHLAHAVYGYFLNGGGSCYVVRIGGAEQPQQQEIAGRQATLGGYRVTALNGAGSTPLTVEAAAPEGEHADGTFSLTVKRGDTVEETIPDLTTARGKDNSVVTAVRQRSKLIALQEINTAGAPVAAPTGAVTLQSAPGRAVVPVAEDYTGDVAARTGLGGLELVDEVTMLAVPDLMAARAHGVIDDDDVKSVQLAMIAHCELMGNRMAILDPPSGLTPQQVMEWRVDGAGYDSKFAALYYPWVTIKPPGAREPVHIPPSGHMAGIWARNDETRGVHKAPANEVIRGAIGLQTPITKAEQDLLNPKNINCLRAFPGRGIRVWGARTLSSDPAWRYLNVRRLFNYLEESILAGTQWVVFEPNDPALWSRIRRTLGAFLVNEWRKGALFGLTPDEAFYVRCDADTNPAEGIDAGEVVCEVGVAPVKPAEFVVFRLSQFSGGTSIVSE